jgi:hypothetical protein
MWNRLKPLTFCAASLILAAGCSHTTGSAPAPTQLAETAPVPAAPGFNAGTVVEVIPAGRYSYIQIEKEGARKWMAVPSAAVSVGQQVDVKPGMEIRNYQSKNLNRTFDSITFSDGLVILTPAKAGAVLPANHPQLGSLADQGKAPAGALEVVSGKVVETIKGSDFTYVCVEKGGVRSWLTVPAADAVAVGEELSFLPGREMRNFNSGKLNRTFDRIIFSGGVDRKK